jgi:hypothetical protein
MKRSDSLIGTIAVASACALLIGAWLHCGSGAPPARGPSTSTAAEPAAPTAVAASSSGAVISVTDTADAAVPAAPQPAQSTVDKVLGEHSEADLRLLAQIEKATGKSPPPEVYAVLKMAKSGASNDELRAYVQSSFKGQILVRKQIVDWLDRRQPDAATRAPAAPAASGPRRVDAFKKTP